MRKAAGYLAILFSIALLFLATAGANSAWGDPPGNNGTVKIHAGATENEPIRANEPHVCTFHIHGFNFDAGASGTWRIEGWPPTGGGTYNGTWGPADGNGDWRSPQSGAMTLPDGHYKLSVWQATPNNPPGGPKQKVFWVECGGATGATGATGASGGSGAGASGASGVGNSSGNGNGSSNGNSTGASTGVTTGATVGPTAVAGVQTAPTAVAGVENLPSTSTDSTIPLGGLGVVLMAVGVALLSRRPEQV